MRLEFSMISAFVILLLTGHLFAQISPEVLENLPPEIREELKNLPPDAQVTYMEHPDGSAELTVTMGESDDITIIPPEYQERLDEERSASMYRGDKLYEGFFFDEGPKMQSIRSLLGITEEQRERFSEHLEKKVGEHFPNETIPVDETTGLPPIEDMLTLLRKLDELGNNVMEETLTPEQIQTTREYFLALPSQIEVQLDDVEPVEILNFDAYDALDLTEEQRNLLKTLREESMPEFLSLFKELTEAAQSKSPSQVEDIRTVLEKMRQHTSRTKSRIVGLMKPEQLAKLERIMKELPGKLASLQAEQKETPEDDSWKKSWKPGDPVPEGAKPPRLKKPFPFGLL